MSIRTTLIPVTLVFAIAGFLAYAPEERAPLRTDTTAPVSEEATTTAAAVPARGAETTRPAAGAAPAAAVAPTVPTATLVVDGTPFTVAVSPEETVLDAMRVLSAEDSLTFTTREYAGLGTLVESINGQKSSSSMNWMLYVNGVSASSGASSESIREGDIIEWKYEK